MAEDRKQEVINQTIESLVKVLGTMVLMPTDARDPINIGKRVSTGTIQQPIILGEDRTIVINKLINLISNL